MTSMRAVTIGSEEGTTLIKDSIPLPRPKQGEVLIKILYAGQNQPDAFVLNPEQSAAYRSPDHILGDDFVGIVVDGNKEALDKVPRGAKVFGWVPGDTTTNGAFAEFLVCHVDLLIRVPDGQDEKQLAALPFSFSTALHALISKLGLDVRPERESHGQPVLIWGAGTACGMYAAQLLVQSGHEVITASGRSSIPALKAFGVRNAYERTGDQTLAESIRSKSPDLHLILDCFASRESIETCIQLLGQRGGHVHALMPFQSESALASNIKVTFDLVHCLYGQAIPILSMLDPYPSEEKLRGDRQTAKEWFSYDEGILYRMLKDNRIKVLPVLEWGKSEKTGSLRGLDGIQEALHQAYQNKLPSGKIVHAITSP